MSNSKGKLLIAIITLLIIYTPIMVKAEENHNLTIEIVNANGEKITETSIYIYKQTSQDRISFHGKEIIETGEKTIKLPVGTYIIYAKADIKETPSIDYVIGYTTIELRNDMKVRLTLIDAAEIKVAGESLDAESDKPGRVMGYESYFTEPKELNGTKILRSFGEKISGLSIEIENDRIIVPANIDVRIEVEVLYSTDGGRYVYKKYYNLTDQPIRLSKGELRIIELSETTLKWSLVEVKLKLNQTLINIERAENDGFYLAIYRSRIPYINELITGGETSLNIRNYDECYSNLREAQLTLNNINDKISQLYNESINSAITIIFLIAFTSTIIGLMIFDKESYGLISSTIIFIILMQTFQILYPGIKTINQTMLYTYSALSYIIATSIILIPTHIKEGERASIWSIIASIASIAKRSLKRRKLRSTLTIFSIIIIVGGFVALTSVSTEEGLKIMEGVKTDEPQGIIVYRNPGDLKYNKFTSMDLGVIDRYAINIKAEEYSFKLESQAKLTPTEVAINPYSPYKLNIYGALAFTNHEDPIINKINERIIGKIPERSGEIAITREATKILDVNIGDEIILLMNNRRMKITGILSDDFIGIMDYDERKITPGKLIITGGEEARIELVDCEAFEIILVSWEDSKIFSLIPSRLYIKISDDETILSLSKRMAISGDYIVKAILQNSTYKLQYQRYMEIRGFEAMLTLAISISNIGVVMLASVYERKREVTILSSIGLNPSHIATIFAFEAIIIGLIAGGMGYITGLTFYKLAYNLSLTIEVYPKVSSSWAMATIIVAALTAIAGSIPA
ncbi:MAG: FtsX-like permease family protein, partial [Candidatus Methanomethylicia archaeon]